jgi:hypothetical protein
MGSKARRKIRPPETVQAIAILRNPLAEPQTEILPMLSAMETFYETDRRHY